MVKYGLPNPISCWSFSVGIPIRSIAIKFSSEFEKFSLMKESDINFENFLKWISRIDQDDLIQLYGLNDYILEEVANEILAKTFNPLLLEHINIESLLPKKTYIKGIQYENRINTALTLNGSETLVCLRDYDSAYDKNAIKVLTPQKEILGFLSREIAQVIAPEMDMGAKIQAHIIELNVDSNIHDIPRILIELFKS